MPKKTPRPKHPYRRDGLNESRSMHSVNVLTVNWNTVKARNPNMSDWFDRILEREAKKLSK